MTRPVFVYHDLYGAQLEAHVFPMEKYRLARARLLAEGDTTEEDWRSAPAATRAELALVHTPEYLDDLFAARWTERTKPSELPLDGGVVTAFVHMAGGTILAAREAMARGTSVNVGGGFHHAFADHGEGFCYLNDIAIAIRVLQDDGTIARAAVIDLDLHQGNGTAHIFHGDDTVFTFSMHQENLYPVKQVSDIDIGLANGTADTEYLALLTDALPQVFRRARPELIVYQAGADPYVEDQLGNLALSLAGLAERDRLVFEACARAGVPCVATFGGGYARRVADTVAIHVGTCRAAIAAGKETQGAAPR